MDFDSERRRFLAAAAATGAMGLAGCAGSDGAPEDRTETTDSGAPSEPGATETTAAGPQLPDAVGLETLATGFEVPLDVAFAPDADRRYVADQPGRVFVHDPDGLRDEPFLDLRETVVTGYEMGLLGLALHPEFAQNRRTFVRYSAPPREGTPDGYSHTFVLAEFEATDDGTAVRPDSERTILEIPEPQSNHNAGSIVFGPEGYLYVGVGDGGGGGDQGTGHVGDWYDEVDGGNGQDVTENLLGSVLRIDVDSESPEATRTGGGGTADGEPSGDRNYAVPDDNPFAGGGAGLPEHYAWGFRNPWRMAFDRGRLLVADVGQSAYEEVNLVERGGNYGWNVREGAHCFSADECPDSTPDDVRGGELLVDPVVEYPHSGDGVTGESVIGGNAYRGSALPGLTGAYVFADLAAEGQLLAATPADEGLWPISVVEVAGDDAGKVGRVYSFGRDADGELYVLANGEDGGGLHRIVPA
ncbi:MULTISPECIES: sorbosone dehydrogenase family protein [Halorussus]|uniref:PQQ-dependent sugar dehydrogenase n=1 Tax=Halorussus TaxID=1070314 RepID=UPI000E20F09C|nr:MULTISPECIES: PQQ-dependent sugar dehydrogenase [Halorussus]NHN60759.1 PQQ-dependent sugar dehydrogenase [Halorussus sp. JP-T4]